MPTGRWFVTLDSLYPVAVFTESMEKAVKALNDYLSGTHRRCVEVRLAPPELADWLNVDMHQSTQYFVTLYERTRPRYRTKVPGGWLYGSAWVPVALASSVVVITCEDS
jgi:hypothetical protein